MTEINHAGYYMPKLPKPEVLIKDVHSMRTTSMFSLMDVKPTFVINLEDADEKVVLSEERIHTILISEGVSCRILPSRSVTILHYIFTEPVFCALRNNTLVITNWREDD